MQASTPSTHPLPEAANFNADSLLSVGQVAALTGLSKGLFNRMRSERRGPPFFKIGGAVRYARSDILEWIANGRRETIDSAARAA